MIRLPSTSTLFPYTTLFRSLAVIGAVVAEFVGADAGLGYLIMIAGANFQIARQFSAIVVLSVVGMIFFWLAGRIERRDRKSTRLNSSHRCISYAVFCLKKKK